MQGAHQASDLSLGHGRLIQAFRAVNGDDHVLLAASAAWALGAAFAADDEPVAVAIASHHRLRRRVEVVPHLVRLDDDEVVETPLGLVSAPARTAFDLARGLGMRVESLDRRVARVDALLRATGLPVVDARAALALHVRARGLPVARRVLGQCRDGVDSPRETALRLLVIRGGLPEPVTQCPVRLPSGQVIAHLDLGWPEYKVGCEYDGQVHVHPDQIRKDLRRHNLIREADWAVVQVDRHQIRHADEVVRQVRVLLAR